MLTAMVRQVQPLRISKSSNTPSSTPNKMATSRPLADIGNTSQRRNSPSYNQATKVNQHFLPTLHVPSRRQMLTVYARR